MKITKEDIVRLADSLIRERGYHGFSYADISGPLQIKNAAVHYYFPSKQELGVAVIRKAVDQFDADTAGWQKLSYKRQLAAFVDGYSQKQQSHCVCLMGALSPVYDTLAPEMQEELKRMGVQILDKLTVILAKGKKEEVFDFPESPKVKAAMIQSSLIASLLLDKVLQREIFQVVRREITKL